ncbi:MAG: hypothetical protein A2041_08100 [Bacteroidetes bacterium GWA2_31_9b]|nr:MAG: hypothetical protein A2041_08100 [Bacteroidetes bacterium GWA2_31_9b]
MKKIVLISLLAIFPVLLNAQDFVDNIIQKYQGKEGFTTVLINKSLFDIAIAIDDDQDLKKMKDMIENIRIIAMEDDSIQNVNFYKEVISQLKVNTYVELMKIKESKQDVIFYAKYNNNIIEELLLIAGGNDENAIISIKGKINLKDLASLSKSVHIDGFEYMDKLNEKD